MCLHKDESLPPTLKNQTKASTEQKKNNGGQGKEKYVSWSAGLLAEFVLVFVTSQGTCLELQIE